jgi:preprotein translocase subunit SecD
MLKNTYFKLGIIFSTIVLSLLVVLPKIPFKIDNKILKLEGQIGGYNISLFNGKLRKDLRELKKGLDLKGGIKVVLKADVSKIDPAEKDKALESAKEVIERRVNMLGVAEPYVATQKVGDDYRIVVEIPGLDNVNEAISLIGQTAQLKYKKLKSDVEWKEDKYYEYLLNPEVWEDGGITGADMRGAEVVTGGSQGDIQNQGAPQIQLRFTNEGREKFSKLAKENVGKPIALFLDEGQMPISAPTVSPELGNGLTGDPVITGSFTFETAKRLAISVRSGALPVPVEVLEQNTIGATLGDESIQRSFFAALVGLLIVFLFLLFKYRGLGLIAGVSLIFYSIIVLAVFKFIPVVLTLPGIAGFVLSIGMATDANILIFERTKEEIMWGKPRNLAIKLGFERAWNSIKDSNISSLITSFILFQFGSGPVRGFALTLAIGIAVSLFTSIFIVRTFIELFNVWGAKHAK